VIWRAGESQADARRRTDGEANAQASAREHRSSLVENLAEGMRGACSMRGAERRQDDLQLAGADFERELVIVPEMRTVARAGAAMGVVIAGPQGSR
jgi:hypothetical protein